MMNSSKKITVLLVASYLKFHQILIYADVVSQDNQILGN